MKYITRTLQPGESIHYEMRIWNLSTLFWAIVFAITAIILFSRSNSIVSGDDLGSVDLELHGHLPELLRLGAAIAALIALWLFSRSGTREFTVTDRRVIFKTGLIARDVTEIPLSHVDTVAVRQTTIERIFGGGHILLRSTGGTSISVPCQQLIALRQAISSSKLDI